MALLKQRISPRGKVFVLRVAYDKENTISTLVISFSFVEATINNESTTAEPPS